MLSSLVMSREQGEFGVPTMYQLPLLFDPASLVTFCPRSGCGAAANGGPLPLAPSRSPVATIPRQREGLNWSLEPRRSPVGMSHPINTEQLPESRK